MRSIIHLVIFLFLSKNSFAYVNCLKLNENSYDFNQQQNLIFLTNQFICIDAFNQQDKTGKHSYDFGVCENGKFNLKINTTFPNSISVEEVFNNYFLNGDKVEQSSNLLSSPPLTNKTKSPRVSNLKNLKNYEMMTSPTKNGKTSTIYSNCSLTQVSTIKIVQTCHLNFNKGDAKDGFDQNTNHQENNSTVIDCEKKDSAVDCKIIVQGDTKPYDGFLGIGSRSAERLAISGAIETLYDMFNLSYMNHSKQDCKPNDSASGIKKSNLHLNKLNKFWANTMESAASTIGPFSKVTINSNETTPAINLNSKECH